MIRKILARLRARVRSFWDLEDPDERIEGSGEVHLDPAYNSRYRAERELKQQAKLADELEDRALDETNFDTGEQFSESGQRGHENHR